MIKLIVGMFSLATLLSGCANQKYQNGLSTSAPVASVTKPTARPLAKISRPVAQKNKKKRLAAQTRSRQEPKKRPATAKKKSTAVSKQEQIPKKTVSLNGTKASCKARLPKLPADADRRSATIGVQCYFIGRGEYLTNTGQVRPL